jgi:hypothetical protein
MADQMILKMQLIPNVYKSLLENVKHAQRKQRKVYATRKRLQTFEGLQKIPKSKCIDLERKDHCLVTGRTIRLC